MARKSDPVEDKKQFRSNQAANLQMLGVNYSKNRAAKREERRGHRHFASTLAIMASMLPGGRLPWHRNGRR